MGALDGRIAIITGAGRGIGREHALLFAAEGAKVVVNDLGGARRRLGRRPSAPAQQVVDEITAAGGQAVANARRRRPTGRAASASIDTALEAFGDLHVLVNNAGILRDRVLVNMSEAGVGRRHPRPPEGPLRPHPARRRLLARADQGRPGGQGLGDQHLVDLGPARQSRARPTTARPRPASPPSPPSPPPSCPATACGSNAIAPNARTRMTESRPRAWPTSWPRPEDAAHLRQRGTRPTSPRWWPTWPPRRCPATGRVYFVLGGQVRLFQPWTMTDTDREGRPLDGGGAAGRNAPARGLSGLPGRRARPGRPGRGRSTPTSSVRPRHLLSGTGSGGDGRDHRPVAPAVPPPDAPPGGPVGPLPVVGPVDRAGRPAVGQHHLHRVRGGPAPGGPPAPHHRHHPDLDVDRAPAGLRGGRARSSASWATSAATSASTCWGLSGAAVSVVLTASAPTAGRAHRRPAVRRGPGGGHRGGVHGPGAPGLLPRGPGQGHGLVGPGRGRRARCSG